MNKILNVYLGNKRVGRLIERDGQNMRFVYDSDKVSPISFAMPTTTTTYYHKATYAFFENLLPEGDILVQIARSKGVSANNPFSLLTVIGEDCAGAISLHAGELSLDELPPKVLTDEEISAIVSQNFAARLKYQTGTRLSLAGAQDKTTVIYEEGKYFIPSFSSPSTHIIKFDNERFENLLLNELFCTTLARKLKLPTSTMTIDYRNGVPFLLIKRFDRAEENGQIRRIHQEDFCQLLSISSKNKYQKEGGPSFQQSAELLKKYSKNQARDILLLAKILVFNFLIGNCDYHGKNLSLLHSTTSLTPFYDLVSTTVYPVIEQEMAMAINGKYKIDQITKEDIIQEFTKWGLKGSQLLALITNDFRNITEVVSTLTSKEEYRQGIIMLNDLSEFIKNQYHKLI